MKINKTHPKNLYPIRPNGEDLQQAGSPGYSAKKLVDEMEKVHQETMANYRKTSSITQRLRHMIKKLNIL